MVFQTSCWYPFMRFNGNSGARSDRFAITDKIFNEMPISLPQDIEEQKRIGIFLTTLDTLITLHQRELDHLKLLKKACYNKCLYKKRKDRKMSDLNTISSQVWAMANELRGTMDASEYKTIYWHLCFTDICLNIRNNIWFQTM